MALRARTARVHSAWPSGALAFEVRVPNGRSRSLRTICAACSVTREPRRGASGESSVERSTENSVFWNVASSTSPVDCTTRSCS